jgi:hypothetical protein
VKKLLSLFRRTAHPDREALSAHLDARLGPAEAAAMTAHLASCAICRTEFDALAATQRLLQSLPDAEPRRSFRLRPSEAEPRPLYRAPSPVLRVVPMLGAAAVIVFAIAAGIDVFSRGGSSNSSADRTTAFGRVASAPTTHSGDLPADNGIVAAPTVARGADKSALTTTTATDNASPAEVAPAPSELTPGVAQAPAPLPPGTAPQPATSGPSPTESADYGTSADTQSAATQPSGVGLSAGPTGAPSAPVTAASRAPGNESGGGIGALRMIEIIAGAAVLAAAGVTVVFRIRNREAHR